MNVWGWPQFVIGLLLVLGFVAGIVKNALDRSIESDRAMANILAWTVYEAVYAYVLHAGGFW